MITNERQYQTTRSAIRRFEESLVAPEPVSDQLSPRIHEALLDGIQGELTMLRDEAAQYEALRAGKVCEFHGADLEDLPAILIQARIAAGLTQRQLAEALGLKEQQIQQYEATQYAAASLRRLLEISHTLHLVMQVHAQLPSAQPG